MTILWNSLSNGQSTAFNPIDTLAFEGATSASQVTLAESGADLVVTVGAKSVTLTGFALRQVTSSNFTFADTSVLLIGDNTTGTVNDDGADSLTGGALSDQLIGLGGNDTLNGGAAADVMAGGTGNDTYLVDSQTDVVTEGADAGTDTVISTTAYYVLSANVENLTHGSSSNLWSVGNALDNTMTGNGGYDTLEGNAGNDTLLGMSANDYLSGGDGNDWIDGGLWGGDTLIGGAGDDVMVVNFWSETVKEDPSGGNDTVMSSVDFTLPDYVENLVLTGTDILTAVGNALNNYIIGNDTINTLDGRSGGIDTLAGGAGDDVYHIETVDEVIVENDGEGNDKVYVYTNAYTLPDHVEDLYLWSNFAFQQATGNALNNRITGGDFNDTIDGGAGADTMEGYDGNDTYYVDNIGDVVINTSGFDLVISTISYSLASGGRNLRLAGSDNLNATGDGMDNQLYGNSGDNVLNGGLNQDWMEGGAGNDTYIVDNGYDSVHEAADAGTDVVQSSISFTLSDNVEHLVLTEAAISANGTGNALGNVLTGNSYVNNLSGAGGNDTLDGGGGSDLLAGGTGSDTFVLAPGSKDYLIDFVTGASGDQIDLGAMLAAATNYTGGDNPFASGHVRLRYAVSDYSGIWVQFDADGGGDAYVTLGNVQNALITALTADNFVGGFDPSAQPNQAPTVDVTITAGTATEGAWVELVNNAIDDPDGGGAPNYQWQGSSDGTNWSNVAGVNGTNSAFQPDDAEVGKQLRLVLTYTDGRGTLETVITSATGAVVNVNDVPTGDVTIGGAARENQTLTAVNTLADGDGLGVMNYQWQSSSNGGGTWNNIVGATASSFVLTNAQIGQIIRVVAGYTDGHGTAEGATTLTTSAVVAAVTTSQSTSWILSSSVDNLELTGTGDINGTGNWYGNMITGNSGNNVLDGAGGADTLTGGAGNDIYWVDDAGDVVTENAAEGLDAVRSSVTLTLSANVETLVLTGASHVNGTGNDLGNIVSGNAGNNMLDGATGADIIAGGPGNDTYVVDNSGDQVMELGNSGIDAVHSAVAYNLMQAWHVENLLLNGGSNVNGSGNWLDNIITGNSGDNVIDGNRGNDTLDGAAGNDTLAGGLGDDVLVWDAADGRVQGGMGNDTLRIDGSGMTLDLAEIADDRITDVEIIDINGSGNNTLTLNASDVLALSSSTDTLFINGGTGDGFSLTGDGWAFQGMALIGATDYGYYSNGAAAVYVHELLMI